MASADGSSPVSDRWIRAAPDLEVVPVEGDLVLATATATLRLSGGVARIVDRRLLPLVAGGVPWSAVRTATADLPKGDFDRLIDRLLEAGLLEEVAPGWPEPPSWTRLVAFSLDERDALALRARSSRVVVVAAAATTAGQVVVDLLDEAEIGAILFADPFRTSGRDDHPWARAEPVNLTFSREAVLGLVEGADLVVSVLDPELSAMRLWVNEAGLARGVPTLHSAIRGSRAEVGPLVLPDDGPCYLCWRMRALACEDDFIVAMAREEALDAVRRPREPGRPTLPVLAPWAGGIVGQEVLAVVTGGIPSRLHRRVLALDGLSLRQTAHPVVARPDCPACGKKRRTARASTPGLVELAEAPPSETDTTTPTRAVVSPVCGLIRTLDVLSKGLHEPELPLIVRAQLANFRFLPGPDGFVECSGKGVTLDEARDGALGEALERYAAMTWAPDRRATATRGELEGPSLDPRDLVLFAEDQYPGLPYAPYGDATVLEWVPARSLITDAEVWVPLLAVHLDYVPADPGAWLFSPSSNGLAAGATLTGSVLRAILEVVERDAFLIGWSHRLPGVRSDARTVPDDATRDIAHAYARRGVRIDVHRLPVDTAATVVLAVAWANGQPCVAVGLGAATDPVQAARRAVLEVAQVRPALRARLTNPAVTERLVELVANSSRVSTLDDHVLLYADPSAAEALGYLRDVPATPWNEATAVAESEGEALRRLATSLADVAGDVLYVDVTPDDLAGLDVHTVRAIVPGFQPIHFGAGQARLGGDRLFRMPANLGLRASPARRAELNLAPHPLA